MIGFSGIVSWRLPCGPSCVGRLGEFGGCEAETRAVKFPGAALAPEAKNHCTWNRARPCSHTIFALCASFQQHKTGVFLLTSISVQPSHKDTEGLRHHGPDGLPETGASLNMGLAIHVGHRRRDRANTWPRFDLILPAYLICSRPRASSVTGSRIIAMKYNAVQCSTMRESGVDRHRESVQPFPDLSFKGLQSKPCVPRTGLTCVPERMKNKCSMC